MNIPRAAQSPYPIGAPAARPSVPITIPTGSTASYAFDLVSATIQQVKASNQQQAALDTTLKRAAFERVRAMYPLKNETFLVDPNQEINWEQVYRDQWLRENPSAAAARLPEAHVPGYRELPVMRDLTRVDFNNNSNPFIPPSNIYMTRDYASSFNFKF